jgi:ubiquinone/menaquinone biosynthesis C-methylase UbiE
VSPEPKPAAPPDLSALRDRQQATWASGDYAVVGATIPLVSENLCEAIDLRAGALVLDVASGSGNAAIAAARRWCDVVGTDYVPSLLARARERSAAEGFRIEFREADAEKQPFPDASFDVVLSVFGAMFAPRPEATAAELLRVCKPGGKIGLASWTPEGFVGQTFKLMGRFVPPPPGARSPLEWGSREKLDALFGAGASSITANRRTFTFRYRSVAHYLETFRTWYGPTVRAFAALDAAGQQKLSSELSAFVQQSSRSDDATLRIPSEYLEVVITKK